MALAVSSLEKMAGGWRRILGYMYLEVVCTIAGGDGDIYYALLHSCPQANVYSPHRFFHLLFHLLVSVILRYLAWLGLCPPVKHFSTKVPKVQVPTYESNTGAYAAMPLLLNSPTTDLVSDLLLMKNNASASLSRYT